MFARGLDERKQHLESERPGYQEKHRKRLMQMAKVGQMRRAKDLPTEGDKSDLRKRGRFVILASDS